MQVILLQDVPSVGKKFEVKNVSDGYVRNFLLPRGLAKPITPANLAEIQSIQAKRTAEEATNAKKLAELTRTLTGLKLQFEVKTDTKGSVFGSVTSDIILSELRKEGILGPLRIEIHLPHPLKTLGEHEVEVDLKNGVRTRMIVILKSEK